MRSNGAAHIGNDTFAFATQDDDAHLFLFTSAFPSNEQRAAVTLERRVRLTPKSTLLSDAAVLKRYLDGLARHTAERDSHPKLTAGPSSANTWVGPGLTVRPADADLVVSSASSSSPDSLHASDDDDDDDKDDDKHQPLAAVRRHALFASPDGQQLIAISNQPRHHYIFDVGRNGHDVVCEFETDALVRSVCWHPERPRILLVLLAGGEVVAYDTANARFGVVYPHAIRLELVPLLRRFARDDAGDDTSNDAAASTKAPKGTVQGEDGVSSSGHERALAVVDRHPPSRFPLPLNAYGQPDHTYAWNRQRADDTAAHAELTQVPHAPSPSPSVASSSDEGAGYQLHEDVRTTMSMRLSSLLRPPRVASSRSPQPQRQRAVDTHRADTNGAEEGAALDTALTAAAAADETTLFQPAPAYGRDIVALAAAGDHTVSDGALTCVHQAGRESDRALPLALRRAQARPTNAFDIVDMCLLPATRSRPVVLLLLSSSGDVFSLKLDEDHLPQRADTQFPDGKLGATDEAVKRAVQQARRAGSPIVHHLVVSPTRSTDEQALRLAATVLDEDTGLCAVVVCWSSGALCGTYVDEPDLIARDVDSHAAARTKPGGFRVQLGAALPVSSLLSPTIASTSHMVHMERQENVLLVRYGQDDAAAFLVALPCWDRVRQGWSFWHPLCSDAAVRARESLRLPVSRTPDGSVPAPLSLRIPYDVTGASVALGLRELVIVPEVAKLSGPRRRHTRPSSASAATSTCPRDFTVVADVVSLLKSALVAQGKGWSLGHDVRASAAPPTTADALLEAVAEGHRAHLCGQPHSVVRKQLDTIGDLLETALVDTRAEEEKARVREGALRSRVEALAQSAQKEMATVAAWQKILLDALVHRRGVEALVTGNDRLGEVHRMLNEYDVILDERRQSQVTKAAAEGRAAVKRT